MRINAVLTTIPVALAILFAGCGGSEPAVNNSKPNANSAVNKPSDSNSNLTTVAKTPEPATNEAPTLGPVLKSFCDAIARKDDAAVRKFYSAAALKGLETDLKEEKLTSLVAYLETDQIADCQISNEKIEGDSATALVKTKGAPNGARWKFVKEGADWKLTGETVDVQAVKQSVSNSKESK